ncbi:LysR substrate-binding domain-containing protein [Paraburkholderia unamae]|uniref:DNA-binding transcriptional LysR family regulator n=1 Tax=Paraburkholderia unamae TaxID=219649 RepID=A0ABX5KDU9_9BURK|nr:LysR substrate-binding domain-containing protein [Paraburkholderia unamae]PVX70713.1 DNA-binding transcriptional LysR family regulator [Paraburkholderia unamae]
MDLLDLEIFSTVAKENSVTRAAHLLNRVQSNVTTRVKQLEDELKVQLFSRDGKRMTLTAEGQRFLGYAQRMLTLAEEARQSMQSHTPVGRLRVGSMESTAAARLPAILGAYQSLWPDVTLEVLTGTTRVLLDYVRASRLDCAFVAETAERADAEFASGDTGLAAVRAFRETLLLVAPGRLDLAQFAQSSDRYPLAAFAAGCTYRRIAEQWLETQADSEGFRPRIIEYASYHAIYAAVAAGTAVAVLPKSVLSTVPASATIQSRPICDIDTYLVSRASYQSAAFDELVRLLPSQ